MNVIKIGDIDAGSDEPCEINGRVVKRILKPKSGGGLHAIITLDDGTGTASLDLKPWQADQVEVGDTLCLHEAVVSMSAGKPQIKTWEKRIDVTDYADPERAKRIRQALAEKSSVAVDYEKYQVSRGSDGVRNLYRKVRDKMTSTFDGVTVKPTKTYVGFKHNTNFVDVAVYRSHLKLFINLKKGLLNDPKKVARDVSNTGHFGNGDYEVRISEDADIEYAMGLVEQSYRKN